MANLSGLAALFPSVDEALYLELHEDNGKKGSHKWYWAIRIGPTLVRLYGRLPGFGVDPNYLTMNKTWGGVRKAQSEYAKLTRTKERKGYGFKHKIPQTVFDFAIQQLRAVTGQVEAEGRAAQREDHTEEMQAFKTRRVEV